MTKMAICSMEKRNSGDKHDTKEMSIWDVT